MTAADAQAPNAGLGAPASKRLALGTLVSIGCNAAKLCLQLLIVPVIARFLGPADYGIYTLAMPSIQLVLMLADGGLGQSLSREDERNEVVWSSAFWLLLALGASLTALVAAWSLPLSIIGHQPALPQYMAPLSVSVFFLALCVCPGARLTRRARVATSSLLDLMATLIASAAAVVAAIFHAGVWSLVIQLSLGWGIRAAAFNLVAFKRPRLVFNWRSVASHSAVGGGIIVTKLIDSAARMLETALISLRFGAADLGAYGFVQQVASSLTQSIFSPIWMGLYVRMLHLKSSREAEVLYHQCLRLIIIVSLPTCLIIGLNANILTEDLLGKSWIGGAFAMALIIPSTALSSSAQLSSAALYAKGVIRPLIVVSSINAALRCSAVSLPFTSFDGMIVLVMVSNILMFAVGLINTRLALGWSIISALNALRGPLLASAAAGVEAELVISRCPPALSTFVISGVMGGFAFITVLCASDWRRLRADFDVVRSLAGR